MNRLLLFLCLATSAFAQPSLDGPLAAAFSRPAPATGGGGGGGTVIINENFESGLEPFAWTHSGTVNYDYTASPLDGSVSLQLDGTASTASAKVGWVDAGGELYARFLLKLGTLPSTYDHIAFFDDSTGTHNGLTLYLLSTGAARVIDESATVLSTTTATMSAGTTYTVWLHYKAGSGANAVLDCWFEAGINTGSPPVDSTYHCGGTNGDDTRNQVHFEIATGLDELGNISIVDDVLIETGAP